jgi:hypothetical protein
VTRQRLPMFSVLASLAVLAGAVNVAAVSAQSPSRYLHHWPLVGAGVAATAQRVYVGDPMGNVIHVFAPDGTLLTDWTVEGDAILDVALNEAESVGILSSDGSGGCYRAYVPLGTAFVGQCYDGRALAYDELGRFVICVTSQNRIRIGYEYSWGVPGTGPGEFNGPSGVAADRFGHIYVADTGNHRVQKFLADGTYISTIGARGTEAGMFEGPTGISCDSAGNLYVCDSGNDRIQFFNANGVFLGEFGQDERDGHRLVGPRYVTVTPQGHVLVLDVSTLVEYGPPGRDLEIPSVQVHYPNGGEILVTGSHYKLAWTATDLFGVANVDVAISRDNGATFETIAANAPNTGSLVWLVTGPGANTSATPIFAGRCRVTARDSSDNTASDESDAAFAIYDLVPKHKLEMTSIGKGEVSRSPNLPLYDHGSIVTITATPANGWAFVGWSGDTTASANPLGVVLDRNMAVTAAFRDAVAPAVSVIFPNASDILVPGSNYKLAWSASDQEGVTDVDLSVSRDSGATWQQVATGVPNTGSHIWLASRPGGNTGQVPVFSCLLRVAAHDSAGNTGRDDSDVPFAIYDLYPLAVGAPAARFTLGPIEPNPTAGASAITYQLPEAAAIRVTIHDLLGREVAVMADGWTEAGTYRAQWNGCGGSDRARAGVYFVRYRTPRGVIAQRIVVAR